MGWGIFALHGWLRLILKALDLGRSKAIPDMQCAAEEQNQTKTQLYKSQDIDGPGVRVSPDNALDEIKPNHQTHPAKGVEATL